MDEFRQNSLLSTPDGFSPFRAKSALAVETFMKRCKPVFARRRVLGTLAVCVILTGLAVLEIKTSYFEARCFSRLARDATFDVKPGANVALQFPADGPYDQRLGYTRLPDFIKRLSAGKYRIEAQARPSSTLNAMMRLGLHPPYREKTQAGLAVIAQNGDRLFLAQHPRRIYENFASLSPLLVSTLLFIENRELLDVRYAGRNPAIEWDRLARAIIDRGIHVVNPDHSYGGGSTLATQLEKFRHSPEGRTMSALEKLRQISSASVRAYREGRDTTSERRRLVVDYLNAAPFAASPGYGEIHGIGDALWAVYGVDFHTVNDLLSSGRPQDSARRALAYKQILSLFIAQRRPSYYLGGSHEALEAETNKHLRILAKADIIDPALRDRALAVRLQFLKAPPALPAVSFVERKAANAIRRQLMQDLGVPRLYDLDRLDLSVTTTLSGESQKDVNRFLLQLEDPRQAKKAGLYGYHLLGKGEPGGVIYSFTLYERVEQTNLVRIQTDNYDQPFDVNEGLKMELGSTAKLRTLITYLELVATLHERFSGWSPRALAAVVADPRDRLTLWALRYLKTRRHVSLSVMLEDALERRYSADPHEVFFTGGGAHLFHNFDPEDNAKNPTVREGFRKSVNLVFIRLMRDIVYHYICLKNGSMTDILEDDRHPARTALLKRFADQEGRIFLYRFYGKHKGKTLSEQLNLLTAEGLPKASRLAVVFRTVSPQAGLEAFSAFLKSRLPAQSLTGQDIEALYEKFAPGKWTLQDRGYIARVHPLELWLVAYLRAHPAASRADVMEASADERRDAYRWLFVSHSKNARKTRIRTLLETEAFDAICTAWRNTGYPFESLVPSYATAIGSSADRPAALAELVGIILNDGVHYPVARIESLQFASETPYETRLVRKPGSGRRVLSPEVARTARLALIDTVEQGTAGHLRRAFVSSDGAPLAAGGKTGTGDNRFETVDAYGQIKESRVINRAAVFVFFIGDRFFGTMTAYVPGPEAASYDFTSALPVRILKLMAPRLMPLLEGRKSAKSAEGSSAASRLFFPPPPEIALPVSFSALTQSSQGYGLLARDAPAEKNTLSKD